LAAIGFSPSKAPATRLQFRNRVKAIRSIAMERTHRTALQAGHTRLYHYEKFCPEWLATTLDEGKIHFSNPANLNDPWDCMPWYESSSIQEPEDIERFILWLRTIANPRPLPQIEAAFEVRLRSDPVYRNKFIEGFSTKSHPMIGRRRIYCLTPDPCSTLMWSHYGDNRRGICLAFDLNNPVFLNTWEVKYSSTYPKWVPHRSREVAMDMLLTKSDVWAYEEEFRIIASRDYPDGHPLKPDGDFIRLPSGSLTAAVIGCKADYSEVTRFLGQYTHSLEVKRIVQVPNHYRLKLGE
jgi:hypothetical protein